MWRKYDKKDKRKHFIMKSFVFIGVIFALILAANLGGLDAPTFKDKIEVGLGYGIIIVVGLFAVLERIKLLFKVKFIGWLILFIAFYIMHIHMSVLLWSLGLVTIPLAYDDIIVRPYFKNLNFTKYWEYYKYVAGKQAD